MGALSVMAEVAERVEAAGPFDGLRDLGCGSGTWAAGQGPGMAEVAERVEAAGSFGGLRGLSTVRS
ncbi:delta 1-pyrroline-5-carboxylate dehydrogenase [Microbacterium testaceum StLB037]|uniref:Delta 1-pyrroline-5-carboxylate dehydrogenase n=1 Tax=Microbacterium testaceum (strain StLB037) TaxID=979556 RepID=E8NAQ3_MICTS|nr:delta 1-pyrroline-5-carboxylate dehydrogenase [Microbacterium testaceum StLB037]